MAAAPELITTNPMVENFISLERLHGNRHFKALLEDHRPMIDSLRYMYYGFGCNETLLETYLKEQCNDLHRAGVESLVNAADAFPTEDIIKVCNDLKIGAQLQKDMPSLLKRLRHERMAHLSIFAEDVYRASKILRKATGNLGSDLEMSLPIHNADHNFASSFVQLDNGRRVVIMMFETGAPSRVHSIPESAYKFIAQKTERELNLAGVNVNITLDEDTQEATRAFHSRTRPPRPDMDPTFEEVLEGYKSKAFRAAQPQEDHVCAAPKCSVCLNKPIEVVFFPCGHACLCRDCSSRVNTCPICREIWTSQKRIYVT